MTTVKVETLDPIQYLLNLRAEGRSNSVDFFHRLLKKRSRLERQIYPRLHNDGIVLSMEACAQGRYLLSGDKRGIISIHDLSPWGSQKHLLHRKEVSDDSSRTHRPIQQAQAPRSKYIISARWYPEDTGMFFSSARSGAFHVWDTNEMLPVLEVKPYQHEATDSNLSCMQVSKSSLSVAVGSPQLGKIKLVDFRSGASSHTLTGHSKGVVDVAWSPISPYLLASGGLDSCIMLWDIRKSGSLACITVLDVDRRDEPNVSRPYFVDGKHLRRSSKKRTDSKSKKGIISSPNNFQSTAKEQLLPLSHSGGVVGLSFDPSGHHLVSAGGNGELSVWNLSGVGCKIPRRFVSKDGGRPVDPSLNGRVPIVTTGVVDEDTTIWTRSGSHLVGYSLELGGKPTSVLKGHLGSIHAIAPIECTGQLVSSATDGLMLLWGPSSSSSKDPEVFHQRQSKRHLNHDVDDW